MKKKIAGITFRIDRTVLYDGKPVGTIKKVKGGWSYFSKIRTKNDDRPAFKKLSICKKSLT